MKSLGIGVIVIVVLIMIAAACEREQSKPRGSSRNVATRVSSRSARPASARRPRAQQPTRRESAGQGTNPSVTDSGAHDKGANAFCPADPPWESPNEQPEPIPLTKQDVARVQDQAGALRDVIDGLEQVVRKAVETQERLLALKMSKDQERQRVAENVEEAEPPVATP